MDVWELCFPDSEQMECIAKLEATFAVSAISPCEEKETNPRFAPSSQESTLIAALQESERKCRLDSMNNTQKY